MKVCRTHLNTNNNTFVTQDKTPLASIFSRREIVSKTETGTQLKIYQCQTTQYEPKIAPSDIHESPQERKCQQFTALSSKCFCRNQQIAPQMA